MTFIPEEDNKIIHAMIVESRSAEVDVGTEYAQTREKNIFVITGTGYEMIEVDFIEKWNAKVLYWKLA